MPEFREILLSIAELLEKKNVDYGDSYAKLRKQYGPTSFCIRIADKLNRVAKLTESEALIEEETIEDTIRDIIGYCTLELKYRRGRYKCPDILIHRNYNDNEKM